MKKILLAIIFSLMFSVASAEISYSPKLVLTHAELTELNLAKELVLSPRIDMLVLSEAESTDFQIGVTQRLNELGWSVSWEDIQATQGTDRFVANFYKYGGKHLRAEVTDVGNNSYKVMFYQY